MFWKCLHKVNLSLFKQIHLWVVAPSSTLWDRRELQHLWLNEGLLQSAWRFFILMVTKCDFFHWRAKQLSSPHSHVFTGARAAAVWGETVYVTCGGVRSMAGWKSKWEQHHGAGGAAAVKRFNNCYENPKLPLKRALNDSTCRPETQRRRFVCMETHPESFLR